MRRTLTMLLAATVLSLAALIAAGGDSPSGTRNIPNFSGPLPNAPAANLPQNAVTPRGPIVLDPAELLNFNDEPELAQIKQAVLQRSRLLADARFTVPVDLWRLYLVDQAQVRPQAPVPFIATDGVYRITIDAQRQADLSAEVKLEVLTPELCVNMPVLTGKRDWLDVQVNDKPASLASKDGWLRFTPQAAGSYTIKARSSLGKIGSSGTKLAMETIVSTRTIAGIDSPQAWQMSAGDARQVIGDAKAGTKGELALSPRKSVEISVEPPAVRSAHAPRYELSGEIAWNQDAAVQQVFAALKVNITGDGSDQIELAVPAAAQRVSVTGPEVREAQVSAGKAAVHLQGKVRGATTLSVSYELPSGGDSRSWSPLGVRDGYWTGGTLIVTNSAGDIELLPGSVSGLKEMPLADVPASAAGLSPAPAALAYRIEGRDFSASIEILRLGLFALPQSIADSAHYEIFLGRDGATMVRVRYEVRNRSRQFMRVDVPSGATVLLAKVNERSTPLTKADGGAEGAEGYLLALERSRTSVMGMTSFPVELAYVCRRPALGESGKLELPLPKIDLTVAYAWGEAYLPPELQYRNWSGAMRPVREFTSKTAKSSLDYGYAAAAEKAGDVSFADLLKPLAGATKAGGNSLIPSNHSAYGEAITNSLAKNYYRSGLDAYDRGDFNQAAQDLQKAKEIAPDSVEGDNAAKLLANPQMQVATINVGWRNVQQSTQEVPKPQLSPLPTPAPTKTSAALGKEVSKELSERNRELRQMQDDLIATAVEDARKGDLTVANARLNSAKALNDKLQEQGESPEENAARMRNYNMAFEQARSDARQKVNELKNKALDLEKQGKNDEAIAAFKELRTLSSDEEIDRQIDRLAAKTVSQPMDNASRGAKVSALRADSPTYKAQRQARIAALTARASVLEEQKKYAEATEVLDQVLVLDPQNSYIMGKRDALQRFSNLRQEGQLYKSMATEWEKQAEGTREAEIPWNEEYRYPKDWKDLASRQDVAAVGASETDADRKTRQRLRTTIPKLDFTNVELKDAIEFLRRASGADCAVDWNALKAQGIDKSTRVNLSLTNVTVEKAMQLVLQDLSQVLTPRHRLGYFISDGVVTISTQKELASKPVTRVYDVRDMIVKTPNFSGPTLDLSSANNAGNGSGGGVFSNNAATSPGREQNIMSRSELVKDITDTIKSTVDKDSWDATGTIGAIRELNGTLVVTQTTEQQEKVAAVLEAIRANRGPNVDAYQQMARQQSDPNSMINLGGSGTFQGGTLQLPQANGPGIANPSGVGFGNSIGVSQAVSSEDVTKFMTENYKWKLNDSDGQAAVGDIQIVQRLFSNAGQTVPVTSFNGTISSGVVAKLGVTFNKGNNNLDYAVIDEAQFRTMMELRAGENADENRRSQRAVVGGDALLANDMTAAVLLARDRDNDFDVNGNSIRLSHESYLLINNGQNVTIVKAGAVRHFMDKTSDEPAGVQVPLNIDLPRVGQQIRFEKTLLEPSDSAVLRAEFSEKGK